MIDHIGQEQAVEGAVFQQLSQLGPVVQVIEAMPLVVRMHPHAMDDMADAIHLEQIDMQALAHARRSPARGGFAVAGASSPAAMPCGVTRPLNQASRGRTPLR